MEYIIRICQSRSCQDNLSEDLFRHARRETSAYPNIEIEKRSCMSFCKKAANVEVVHIKSDKTVTIHEIDYHKLDEIIEKVISAKDGDMPEF